MGFRVAEAAVILDDLWPLWSDHQAEIQTTLECPSFRVHRFHGGKKNLPHTLLRNLRRVIGIRGDGTHSAGIQADVTIPNALVVHAGDHGNHAFSISKGKDGNLRSCQEFFDHDAQTAVTEFLVQHHGAQRVLSLLHRLGDHDALPQSKSVRFHDDGRGLLLHIGYRLFQIGEVFIRRSGDSVFFHQPFGENLAAFNDCRVFSRSEARNSGGFQFIHSPQDQGIIRGDDSIVDPVFLRKFDLGGNILCRNGDAFRIRSHASISGQRVDCLCLRAFFQGADQCVLPSTAADHHDFHPRRLH